MKPLHLSGTRERTLMRHARLSHRIVRFAMFYRGRIVFAHRSRHLSRFGQFYNTLVRLGRRTGGRFRSYF